IKYPLTADLTPDNNPEKTFPAPAIGVHSALKKKPDEIAKETQKPTVEVPDQKDEAPELRLKSANENLEELSRQARIASEQKLTTSPEISEVVNKIILFINTHQEAIASSPELATIAHQILHNLAQYEIQRGNHKEGFEI